MGPAAFQALPAVPRDRVCGCGQRVSWSHLEYLGKGRSAAVYSCHGCGLVYRGPDARREGAAPRASRRPLPAEGPPDNPVLDQETAARLEELLGG